MVGGRQFKLKLSNQIALYHSAGHEDWVYSVRWHPSVRGARDQSDCSSVRSVARLLSASMDKTVIVWRADLNAGLWVEEVGRGRRGGGGREGGREEEEGKREEEEVEGKCVP